LLALATLFGYAQQLAARPIIIIARDLLFYNDVAEISVGVWADAGGCSALKLPVEYGEQGGCLSHSTIPFKIRTAADIDRIVGTAYQAADR
jgi:hypothetical protein